MAVEMRPGVAYGLAGDNRVQWKCDQPAAQGEDETCAPGPSPVLAMRGNACKARPFD